MRRKNGAIKAAKLAAVLGVALFSLLVLISPAAAQGPTDESAARKAPAQDCAIITSMPGFPKTKATSVQAEVSLGNEGVVIRQSYIKDGKIVIPPQGLYYTTRISGDGFPLANYPVLVLGKVYYLANLNHNFINKTDFVMKKGEAFLYGKGPSALELSSLESRWGASSPYQSATFQVLKESGNYYGGSWVVNTGGPYARTSEDALGQKAASGVFFQQDKLSSSGTVYLQAKEVTNSQVTVAEWVANEAASLDLATKTMTATLAVGETFDLGTYKAKLLELDSGAKTAKVAILGADGKSLAEKTLGPLTDKGLSLLASDDAGIASVMLQHQDVLVGLSAYTNPFKDAGKVALVGMTGVFRMASGEPWPQDPRFLVFPDT